jgi:hypothetical protein
MFEPILIVYLVIKAAFFATLLKAFVSSESLQEKPWLMALVYTGGVAALSYIYFVMGGAISPDYWKHWVIVNLVLSFLYYWLLARFEDVAVIYWTVLILGLGLIIY